MANAPTPRPAKGFSSGRAQSWILVAAILTGVIYAFRRIVEPTTGTGTQSSSSKLATLAGAGPPPSLEHWAVSYGAAFLMLSVLALGAPELAASLAAMMVLGNLLTNGTTIAADVGGLEGKPVTPVASTTSKAVGQAVTGAAAATNLSTGANPL